MRECIDLMADAFRSLAREEAVQPLRGILRLPDRSGLLATMPGYVETPSAYGLKVITVTPGNHGTPLDSHQGAVLLFDARRGNLVAIIDATSITSIRTAAVSAVATAALARADAGELALLGSGVQARAHLEAIQIVRPLRRARVWSRSYEHARDFAARETSRRGIPVEAARSAPDAVRDADIICTTTAAREPVLQGAWISPGAHVNAVGSSVPTSRELDTDAVLRSRLFVDRRESALHEAGDIVIPLAEGALPADPIAGEIGEVLLGRVEGRQDAGQITLFKSLGLAVEDLAAAQRIHENAAAGGIGLVVDLGGARLEAD